MKLKIEKRCHFLITWSIGKDLVIIVDVKGLYFILVIFIYMPRWGYLVGRLNKNLLGMLDMLFRVRLG